MLDPLKDVPDIAIEVVLTSSGIDKLAVYAGLGMPEACFFENGQFPLFDSPTMASLATEKLISPGA